MRDLHAGLVAVRSVDGAIDRVGKALDPGGRHLPGGQERERRGRCSRAADRPLLESPLNRRDRREQHLRVGQVAAARPFRGVEQLPDAARQPVVEDAVPGANDAAIAVGERGADARLDVVAIPLQDVARRIQLEVVPQTVGHRQPWSGRPLILDEEAVGAVVECELRIVHPVCRHRLGPGRADPGIGRSRSQVRPPEQHGRERLQGGQVGKHDARRKEQVPGRIVAQEVEIDAALDQVRAAGPGEAVRNLPARLGVVIHIGRALAHDDEVRDVERRLVEDGRKVERSPCALDACLVDQLRRHDRHEVGDECLIAGDVVARRARCR